MNGGDGISGSNFGGGGSGGSINIQAATIAGSGGLGIDGGASTGSTGVGSGGRLYLGYTTANTYSGTITNTGATNGTVVIVDETNNDLYITKTQTWDATSSLEGSSHTYNDVEISGNSTLTLIGFYDDDLGGTGFTFNAADFEIQSGSKIDGDELGYAGGPTTSAPGEGPGGGVGGGGGYNGGGGGHEQQEEIQQVEAEQVE